MSSAPKLIVICSLHGPMRMNHPRYQWECDTCKFAITHELICRIRTETFASRKLRRKIRNESVILEIVEAEEITSITVIRKV